MSATVLERMAGRLRAAYGAAAAPLAPYRWSTLVEIVAGSRQAPGRGLAPGRDGEALAEFGPLDSARETAGAQVDALAEQLERLRRPSRMAASLVALARWWMREPAREDELPDAWQRPAAVLREELRSLRGVSITLADRLLMIVGRLPAFPLDRAAQRIAARHAWVDPHAEYAEWQEFFELGGDDAPNLRIELSQQLARVGREHCGPIARCRGCPLEPMLPPSGPVPLDDADA